MPIKKRKYLLAWLLVCAPAVALHAQEPAAEGEKAEPTVLDDARRALTVPELEERERAIHAVIRKAFDEKSNEGAWQHFSGMQATEIDPRALALAALTRNLDIYRQHLSRDIAAAALQEAQALFDPTLQFSFNYNNTREYERKEDLLRFKRGTVLTTATDAFGATVLDANGRNLDATGATLPPAPPLGNPETAGDGQPHHLLFFDDPNSLVRYIGFNQARPEGFDLTTETAHKASITGDNEVHTALFNVTQPLPWGVNLALNYSLKHHNTAFVNNPDSNNPTSGDYDRPWTSSITGSVSLPFPYSKNWGPESAQNDVTRRLAILSDEQAVWVVKDVINTTLLDVDLKYWDLVRSANNLYAAVENLRNVQALIEKTEKMYELREVTEYYLTQVRAEAERLKGEVELAKSAYISASNALHPLVNEKSQAVYLPLGYTLSLSEPLEVPPGTAKAEAVGGNPLLKAQTYNVQSSEVVLRQRELQRKELDASLSASASAIQLDTLFGYSDTLDSMNHVFDPDLVQQNYGLTVTRPWGNRAPEALYVKAGHEAEVEKLRLKGTENALSRALRDAHVGLVSAKARTDVTASQFRLAKLAYDKAAAQQRSRGVTEYEIIRQSNSLLAAHRNFISAVIDAKQAEARYLAASGALPARYAERTAQTMVDDVRVRMLKAQGLLPVFAQEGDDANR